MKGDGAAKGGRATTANGDFTANGDGAAAGDGAADGVGAAAGALAATLGEATRDASPRRTGAGSSSSSNCPIAERAAGRAGIGVAPGELIWGGVISTAAVRRIACCAGIQRVVLDPSGAVLDVGREYRTATPAQFAALIARDGGCAFPGCTRPASWCIAHHITHWVDGGETNLDNLVLLCTWHHTVVHHHGWDVRLGADRLPDFYPPPWVDPDRTPRRNTRPRHRPTVIVPYR